MAHFETNWTRGHPSDGVLRRQPPLFVGGPHDLPAEGTGYCLPLRQSGLAADGPLAPIRTSLIRTPECCNNFQQAKGSASFVYCVSVERQPTASPIPRFAVPLTSALGRPTWQDRRSWGCSF